MLATHKQYSIKHYLEYQTLIASFCRWKDKCLALTLRSPALGQRTSL